MDRSLAANPPTRREPASDLAGRSRELVAAPEEQVPRTVTFPGVGGGCRPVLLAPAITQPESESSESVNSGMIDRSRRGIQLHSTWFNAINS